MNHLSLHSVVPEEYLSGMKLPFKHGQGIFHYKHNLVF